MPIDIVINPDKTLTMTLTGPSQAIFDQLLAAYGGAFLKAHFNTAFNQLARQVTVRDKEELFRQYRQLSQADKDAIDAILQGGP